MNNIYQEYKALFQEVPSEYVGLGWLLSKELPAPTKASAARLTYSQGFINGHIYSSTLALTKATPAGEIFYWICPEPWHYFELDPYDSHNKDHTLKFKRQTDCFYVRGSWVYLADKNLGPRFIPSRDSRAEYKLTQVEQGVSIQDVAKVHLVRADRTLDYWNNKVTELEAGLGFAKVNQALALKHLNDLKANLPKEILDVFEGDVSAYDERPNGWY